MEDWCSGWQHLQIRMSIGDLKQKPLQVEQPLVKIMSTDHECMIRGCFANGTDSYQTKRCDIFNRKNIYRKGDFLMETFWLDDKSYFWYHYYCKVIVLSFSNMDSILWVRIVKKQGTFNINKVTITFVPMHYISWKWLYDFCNMFTIIGLVHWNHY